MASKPDSLYELSGGIASGASDNLASKITDALQLVDQRLAQRMLSRCPSLLHLSIEETVALVSSVMAAINMSREQTVKALCRQPALLDIDPYELSSQLRRMASLLNASSTFLFIDTSTAAHMLTSSVLEGRPRLLNSLFKLADDDIRKQLIDLQIILDSRLSADRSPNSVQLVLRNPLLLLAQPSAIESSLDAAIRTIQVPRRRMTRLLLRCPEILTLSPNQVASQLSSMVEALRLSPPIIIRMLQQESLLFKIAPNELQLRMAGLQHALFLPRSQAVLLVVRQPELLTYRTVTLQRHLMSFHSMLHVRADGVHAVLNRHPSLLCCSPRTLEGKMVLLSSLLSLSRAKVVDLVMREPCMLTVGSERITENCEKLQQLLLPTSPTSPPSSPISNLSDATTTAIASSTSSTQHPQLFNDNQHKFRVMLHRYPLLLLEAPDRLSELVNDLALLLAIPETSASSIVLDKPAMLIQQSGCSDPRLWQSNLDTLASRLGLEMARIRSLVLLRPSLLFHDPQALYHKCTELREVLEAHPHWIKSFESASASILDHCLRIDLARLRYLKEDPIRAASWTPDSNGFVFDSKLFEKEHPGYMKWLRGRKSKAKRRKTDWSE